MKMLIDVVRYLDLVNIENFPTLKVYLMWRIFMMDPP